MPQSTAASRCILTAFQALMVIVVATPLRAQTVGDSVLVIVGDRIRASTADTTIAGVVTRLTNRGFELERGATRQSFAYRDLDALEVSRGVESAWIKGAALGLAAGGIVGLTQGEIPGGILGEAVCVLGGWIVVPWWCFRDHLEKALAAGAIGSAAGAAVGALIRREAWESIPLADDRDSFSFFLAPQRGHEGGLGFLLGGQLRF